jgi:hypothetical protein
VKRWLLTTAREEDLDRLREDLSTIGGLFSDAPPIPLEPDELAIAVEGPDDLPELLGTHPAVRKVSPDSDVTFYRD